MTEICCSGWLEIGTGNPRVFQGYPHLYHRKPIPVPKGTGTVTGFAKTPGYATHVWVHPQNQLKNLATALQVSIDTALQHCEVSNVVEGWYIITNVEDFTLPLLSQSESTGLHWTPPDSGQFQIAQEHPKILSPVHFFVLKHGGVHWKQAPDSSGISLDSVWLSRIPPESTGVCCTPVYLTYVFRT